MKLLFMPFVVFSKGLSGALYLAGAFLPWPMLVALLMLLVSLLVYANKR